MPEVNIEPVAGPSRSLQDITNIFPANIQSAQPQIQSNIKEKQMYIKCTKYVKKISALQQRMKIMKRETSLKDISENKAVKKLMQSITPAFAVLLQGQLRNLKKKKPARRWSKEEKITALRIFKKSPSCYR